MEDFILKDNKLVEYTGSGGDVVIPDGVVEIYAIGAGSVFYECDVTSITLPSSVERIDSIAFSKCPKLTAFHVDSENKAFCEIDGILFSKNMKELKRCPEAYSGEVIIPEGVEVIKCGAFSGCSLITSVVFPETVVEIEGIAFSDCSSIKTFILPESLKTIGQDAFWNMDSMVNLVIPKNVSQFGIWQADVANSKSLESIEVDADNTTYKSIDGMLFSKTGRNIQFCPLGKKGSVILPANVMGINAQAFAGCEEITEITIPYKVNKIGWGAFSGCKKIKSITIPSRVKKIDGNVFAGCSCLESIEMSDGIAQIEEDAFAGCDSLKRIELPKTVTKISKKAFSNNIVVVCYPEIFKKLSAEIKINTSIDYLTNSDSYNQEQSAGVKEFIAGSKGKVLKAIIEQNRAKALVEYNAIIPLTKKEITSSIKVATEGGFIQVTAALLEIQNGKTKAPVNVTAEEFNNEKTSNAVKTKTNKSDWKKPKAGTTLIGRYTGTATKVTFPSEYDGKAITGTADVADSIPDNYREIESIVVPEGYTVIGKNTFAGCENLVSITLPSTLRTIGFGAFKGCKSLKTLAFPEGMSSFGRLMFEECNFETIELPKTLEFLPKQCFDGAIVDTIIFRGSVLTSDGRVFDWGNEPKAIYTDGKIKIYNITKRVIKPLKELANRGVIKEKTEAEIKKEWSFTELKDGTLRIDDYKGLDMDIIIPEKIDGKTVTEIGEGVFYAGSDLMIQERKISALQKDVRNHIVSITVPTTVVKIGKEAFMGCTVNIVKMPDSIVEIGEGAFKNCKSLQEFNMPSGLKTIGQEAFSGIHTIDKWILPQGLETICQGAFVYSSINEIHIPDTVVTIGKAAISNWLNADLIIYGKAGSVAEQFAMKNQIKFEQE